jgi:chromosome segregation ATPase
VRVSRIPEEKESNADAKLEGELKKKFGVIKEIPRREIQEVKSQALEQVELPKEEGEFRMHDLILKVEKLDGKLDIIDRFRNDMNERVTQLAEEIGELRTMMMERDRAFDKISTNFEKVEDVVQAVEPMTIRNEFERIKVEILKNDARFEKLDSLVKALSEENKKFREMIEKIKSFENLVDISYEMDRKLSKIKEVKDYADKTAAKVESIFSELNEKVSEREGEREKIKKLDELTIEMAKMLDEISVKLSKFTEKKDLDEFRKNIEEDMKKIKAQPQTKTNMTIPKGQVDVSELTSQIARLNSVVESHSNVVSNINKRLDELGPAQETKSLRNVMLSLRFFQIMNLLTYVKEPEKIRNYLSELKDIAGELKQNGIWNEEKESFMKEILDKVSRSL